MEFCFLFLFVLQTKDFFNFTHLLRLKSKKNKDGKKIQLQIKVVTKKFTSRPKLHLHLYPCHQKVYFFK